MPECYPTLVILISSAGQYSTGMLGEGVKIASLTPMVHTSIIMDLSHGALDWTFPGEMKDRARIPLPLPGHSL
jgi:hypothetical protein